MSALTAKKVIKNLTKKGFRESGGDHVWLDYYDLEGRKTNIQTKTSRGSNHELGTNMLHIMGKQVGLSLNDFIRLGNCDMDQEEYERVAKDTILGTHLGR